MSSPSGIVTRVMMISTKRLVSRVCIRPAGERQQRLAGAGWAQHRDEVDFRIHQQV